MYIVCATTPLQICIIFLTVFKDFLLSLVKSKRWSNVINVLENNTNSCELETELCGPSSPKKHCLVINENEYSGLTTNPWGYRTPGCLFPRGHADIVHRKCGNLTGIIDEVTDLKSKCKI
jgi:hypothetical protein